MRQGRTVDVDEMILSMADIVCENRSLRKEIEKYRMKSIMYDARLYGKKKLAEKMTIRFRKMFYGIS